MDHFNQVPIELPHNIEAEQGLLGCLLVNNACYDDAAQILSAEDFYFPAHAEIFTTIERCVLSGNSASPVTLKTQFDQSEFLKEQGGGVYLMHLASAILSTINAKSYATTIRELGKRRSLIMGLRAVIDTAQNASLFDGVNVMDEADRVITSLSAGLVQTQVSAQSAILNAIDFSAGIKSGKIKPIRTGLRALDAQIGGLYGGCVYVIAGRPGMGKTVLGLNIAANVSDPQMSSEPIPALFCSIEMPAMRLGQRLLATATGITIDQQQSPHELSHEDWAALSKAGMAAGKQLLSIEDCAGITFPRIVSLARAHKRKHGRFVYLIDYLGLIKSSVKTANRVHEIEEITTGLKALAKELDIPIILLSQLSRKVEEREDKRPQLSDLRDSGSIEQDADVIIFPFRAEYYLAREEPQHRAKEGNKSFDDRYLEWQGQLANARGKAELIIAKQRYGRPCSVKVAFDGERQVFHDH